jgi:hypothetical protein
MFDKMSDQQKTLVKGGIIAGILILVALLVYAYFKNKKSASTSGAPPVEYIPTTQIYSYSTTSDGGSGTPPGGPLPTAGGITIPAGTAMQVPAGNNPINPPSFGGTPPGAANAPTAGQGYRGIPASPAPLAPGTVDATRGPGTTPAPFPPTPGSPIRTRQQPPWQPGPAAPGPTPPGPPQPYTVRSGDSLWKIGQSAGVGPEVLGNLNNQTLRTWAFLRGGILPTDRSQYGAYPAAWDYLYVGEPLMVPGGTPAGGPLS